VVILETEKTYEIFTDASFDAVTKVGTYAIVITQDKKVINSIAKKCDVQLENSTECEIFAIFRAINIVERSLLKKNVAQKFCLRTDCSPARDFFVEKNKNKKIFERNEELLNTIKKSYERVKKRLEKKDCSFKLKWISRWSNKIAHQYSYSVFQQLKQTSYKKDVILMDKEAFLELLQKFNLRQYKVIIYLFQISNDDKFIVKTQNEIAKALEIPISYINKTFQELIKLNVLTKIENGKYSLTV